MKDKLLIAALKRQGTERVPFWFMRQAGRYLPEYRHLRGTCKGFLDLCYTPDKAAEVTLQPVRRFGMDAAILFSDILVVPHALGCELAFVEGEGPKLKPIESKSGLATLSLSRVEVHIQPVLQTVRQAKAQLAADKTLIGFAGSPWTVACYMIEGGSSREFEKAKRFIQEQPGIFSKLITLLEQATLLYLKAQVDAGAEVIQLFDSWAGLLSPAEFSHWVIAPTRRIAQELKKTFPHIPIIGFPRLAGTCYVEYARDTGVDGVSVDQTAKLGALCGENIVLQGNLDPYSLAHDLPGALAQARQLCQQMRGRPYIFNLGHGMLPQTPVEHVEALCYMLKDPYA